MYNSKDGTVDKELTFLSYNQCINKEFPIGEILNSPLWITDYSYIFEDVGVTGNKNNNWYTSNMLSSTDDTGTTVYKDNAYGAIYADDPTHTAYFDWEPPFTVELDVISFNNANLLIYDGTTQVTQPFTALRITENNHLKVVNDGYKVRWFVDDVENTLLEQVISPNVCQIALRTGKYGGAIKYKNFRIHRSNIVKAIPLFNCDSIQSNNPNDIILDDNKCVILNNDDNTIITVKSDDTGSMHIYDVILHAYAPYSLLVNSLSIYCIVYDEFMNPLTNTAISVKKDGTVIDTVKTDYNGVCEYKVEDAGSYKFIYDEKESETITINSGE